MRDTISNPGRSPLWRDGAVFALLAVAAISSVAWQGFSFPTTNNAFHIPIVLDYFRSAEGPHDAYHAKLANFVSCFWVFLSWGLTDSTLLPGFLVAHGAARFFFLLAVYLIIVDLGADRPKAAILAALSGFLQFYSESSLVARNEILPSGLTHTGVVVPVVLFCWHCLLKQRWVVSALLLGLAFNVNAFVAIWSTLVHGFVLWRWHGGERWRAFLLQGLASVAGFVALAWPTLIWIATLVVGSSGDRAGFSYRAFIRDYFPYHNLVDVQVDRALIEGALFVGTWVLCARAVLDFPDGRFATLRQVCVALMAIVGFGSVLPYVSDSRLLSNLYPLRMDSYVYVLTGLVVLARIALTWNGMGDPGARAAALLAAVGLLSANAAVLLGAIGLAERRRAVPSRVALWALSAALLALGAVLAFAGTAPVTHAGPYPRLGFLVAALALGIILGARSLGPGELALFVAVAATGLPVPEAPIAARLALSAPVLVLAAAIAWPARVAIWAVLAWVALVGGMVATGEPLRVAATLCFGALACLAGVAVRWMVDRLISARIGIGMPMAGASIACAVLGAIGLAVNGGLVPQTPVALAWMDAQRWARLHTPPDTQFFAPADRQLVNFATFSRRPSWYDPKMGATVMWAPEFYSTWAERRAATQRIERWSDVQALADRAGISYAVLTRGRAAELGAPMAMAVHANDHFLIFRLRSCRPRGTPSLPRRSEVSSESGRDER